MAKMKPVTFHSLRIPELCKAYVKPLRPYLRDGEGPRPEPLFRPRTPLVVSDNFSSRPLSLPKLRQSANSPVPSPNRNDNP